MQFLRERTNRSGSPVDALPRSLGAPRHWIVRTAAVLSATVAVTTPGVRALAAEPVELEGSLQELSVTLEAAYAQVNVVLDSAAATPWYYVTDPSGETSECAPSEVGLDCFGPDRGTKLRIDLVLPPTGTARIRGTELDLAIGPLDETAGADSKDDPAGVGSESELEQLQQQADRGLPFGPLEVTVVSSQVYWTGAVPGSIVAQTSTALLERVRGDFQLDLTESDLQATDLRGQIQTRATGGSIELRGTTGAIGGTTSGTQWTLDGVQGRTALTLTGGSLQSNGSTGPLELTGEAASIRLEGGTHPKWSVQGEEMVVTAGRVAGSGTLKLSGGSFEGDELGDVTAELEAATLALRGGSKNATVKVRAGSDASLRDIAGRVDAEVVDSSLLVESPGSLQLTATEATIRASDLARTGNWSIRDSKVELDLARVQGSAQLKLDGASEAEVQLPSPCFVALQGRTTPLSQGLEVSGCELRSNVQRRRGGAAALARLDGGRGVVLRIDLDSRASARISSRD